MLLDTLKYSDNLQALIRLCLLGIEVDKSCPETYISSDNANHSHWPYTHRTMLVLPIFVAVDFACRYLSTRSYKFLPIIQIFRWNIIEIEIQ